MNSIAAYAVAIAWIGNGFEPSETKPSAPQRSGPSPAETPRVRGDLAGGDFARSELRFVRLSRHWDALIRRLAEPMA